MVLSQSEFFNDGALLQGRFFDAAAITQYGSFNDAALSQSGFFNFQYVYWILDRKTSVNNPYSSLQGYLLKNITVQNHGEMNQSSLSLYRMLEDNNTH